MKSFTTYSLFLVYSLDNNHSNLINITGTKQVYSEVNRCMESALDISSFYILVDTRLLRNSNVNF